MARALENPEPLPGYLDFFGMTRAPFARLTEATAVFHAEQYSLFYAHLSDAAENADRLLALYGADGSGKTTLLSRYIAGLSRDTYFAAFDETWADATQFYSGLLRQLGFSDITGNLKELRHISREFLLHRGRAGDPVLLIVDNAHLVSPSILEQLRWLGEIKLEDRSVISLVLAGNADLERVMASPAMSLLSFGRQVDFNLRVLTERETDDYVRHRLRLAGGADSTMLSTRARPLIHRFSGGNPSLINGLCNALLGAALAQKTRVISEALVRRVADEQDFVPHVQPLAGHGRRDSDLEFSPAAGKPGSEEPDSGSEARRQAAPGNLASARGQTDADRNELLARVALLQDQLDASAARTERALLDVDARDDDINALLEKIAQQSTELEQAECAARENVEQIERLGKALQASRQLSNARKDELKTARSASRKAETTLGKVSRKLEKLECQKADLQTSMRELKAGQRKSATQARRDLKASQKTIAELEQRLAGLQEENESLLSSAQAAAELEEASRRRKARGEELQSELEADDDDLTTTQLQMAVGESGSDDSTARPAVEGFVGDITALEVFRNGELEQALSLEPGQRRLIIGRSDDNELCLKSRFVSRHHALLLFGKERACIENLRSFNGTIVNGRKVSRCDLNPDDRITIGEFELRPRHS